MTVLTVGTNAATRAGLRRGLIEFRQQWTNIEDLFGQVIWMVLMLGTVFFMRNAHVPGSAIPLGAMTVASLLGAGIVFGALNGAAGFLVVDREDGTLLRAKATPNGMLGYLIGKTVSISLSQLIGVVVLLVPCLFLYPQLREASALGWLHLVWVLVLGLCATMPIGAALGSLITNPRSIALITLPILGLGAISGIFYPITALPVWLQDIAQVFPMYWLGLGMRAALLPDASVAVEIGQSWRTLPTLGVLVAWTVIGLALAPALLRRMARRESGSSVAARRERALRRAG